jgi:hypothetical protein
VLRDGEGRSDVARVGDESARAKGENDGWVTWESAPHPKESETEAVVSTAREGGAISLTM